jgi:arsenate reductase
MSRITAYLHPKCSTCEEARQWLAAHKVTYMEKDIRESAPTPAELRAMLKAQGGQRKKLLNTSGIEYRKQGLAARLPSMNDDEALALLGTNGMFVKRPFLIGPSVGLVGFDEQLWSEAFKRL